MLTFFTTAKPFKGHDGTIQCNALKSWRLLHPDVDVILFGDEEGAEEVAQRLGLRHEPHTEKNEFGSNRLDYMFSRAQDIARHDVLCYANCDILLMQDFCVAMKRVLEKHTRFLMVGRRWDVEISETCDFRRKDWQMRLRTRARQSGKRRTAEWIDFFVFSKGFYGNELPPFAIGRSFWDNWLVWKALDSNYPVIDVSAAVLAVHQNHEYAHHPQGKSGVFHGSEAGRNCQLAGGWRHLRTIADATEVLRKKGLQPNRRRHWSTLKRYARQAGRVALYDALQPVWFALLGMTRPVRAALGLRAGILHRCDKKFSCPLEPRL